MNPAKVVRSRLAKLTDLPNVGAATAADLRLLGINKPGDLVGKSPYALYDSLCAITGVRHNPCVIDVFISVTRFMAGEDPRPWWAYTSERKRARRGESRAAD
ncbi:helix-hairpin-helix domain-containing protein [bacterium BD-1]|nr:helix-hairpin-helix domain-containing protein [Ottowia caeni]